MTYMKRYTRDKIFKRRYMKKRTWRKIYIILSDRHGGIYMRNMERKKQTEEYTGNNRGMRGKENKGEENIEEKKQEKKDRKETEVKEIQRGRGYRKEEDIKGNEDTTRGGKKI